jgi:WD40 repeat protein
MATRFFGNQAKPALVGLAAILALLAASIGVQLARRAAAPPDPVGVWEVSDKQIHEVNAKAPDFMVFAPPPSFRFDGDTVYLQIIRMRPWDPGPEDNVWRLKARWKDDTLYYLAPSGFWTKLATFRGGHFLITEDKVTWVLEKTDPARLDNLVRPFMKKNRPVWGYPVQDGQPPRLTLEWGTRPDKAEPVEPLRVIADDPETAFALEGQPFGHVGVAWSPDERRFATFSSSWDAEKKKHVGYAKVWDAVAGKPEGRLEGLPEAICAAAFSPDGNRLALADDGGVVDVWNAAARHQAFSIAAHAGPARTVAFSPDGTLLASGGDDRTVAIWDGGTGAKRRSLKGSQHGVTGLAFSANGRRLLAAYEDGGVKVWDLATGNEERSLPGMGRFCTAAFDPEGKRVAVGGYGVVKVWELATGRPEGRVSRRQGHHCAVAAVAFSPDGQYLASSGSEGRDVKLWEAATGRPVLTITGHGGEVRVVAFSQDGRFLRTCYGGECIMVLDLAALLRKRPTPPEAPLPLGEHEDWVWAAALTPDGKTLVSGSKDETVRLWDVASGKVTAVLAGHLDEVHCVACAPDGKTLASGSDDGEVKLWDLVARKEWATLEAHDKGVRAVTFSADGKLLVSASYEGPVKLWDAATGQARGTLSSPVGPVEALAVTPDGKLLATGGHIAEWDPKEVNQFYRPGEVTLWEADTWKPVARFRGYPSAVTCLAVTADGHTLAAGSDDKTVRLYDLAARKETAVLKGHAEPVRSVAVTADGKLVASGDWKGVVNLWDVASGKRLASFSGHSFWVNALVFTPDGKKLISASADHTVKFWDVAALLQRALNP